MPPVKACRGAFIRGLGLQWAERTRSMTIVAFCRRWWRTCGDLPRESHTSQLW